MLQIATVVVAAVISGSVSLSQVGVEEGKAYRREIEAWRHQRVERLTMPSGWLTLVGLEWLKPGLNTVGSGKDNAIVLPKGPERLGTITLENGRTSVEFVPDAHPWVDERPVSKAVLRSDATGKPSMVQISTLTFNVVQRADKIGLRIRDSEADTRTHFLGIDYFDIDPKWRVEAKWEAYNPPHEVEVSTMIGTVEKYKSPGAAIFERSGKSYRVKPVIEVPGAKELFLVFADKTSGKETYGAARFLYADLPKDGKIVLDFNKAYNPPCAFTAFATCPLPTAQNRLDLRVNAGEKKYRGEHPAEKPAPKPDKK